VDLVCLVVPVAPVDRARLVAHAALVLCRVQCLVHLAILVARVLHAVPVVLARCLAHRLARHVIPAIV
jgi:hypothetical protein